MEAQTLRHLKIMEQMKKTTPIVPSPTGHPHHHINSSFPPSHDSPPIASIPSESLLDQMTNTVFNELGIDPGAQFSMNKAAKSSPVNLLIIMIITLCLRTSKYSTLTKATFVVACWLISYSSIWTVAWTTALTCLQCCSHKIQHFLSDYLNPTDYCLNFLAARNMTVLSSNFTDAILPSR